MAISTLNEDELKSDAKEYLRWRSKRIGSSDLPAILGESPFKTAYQLWREKTGRVDSSFYTNHAIELGKQFEDTVRIGLEMQLDIDFPPTIMTDDLYPFMTSSLDGYSEEHSIVLEIKSVMGEPTWVKACEGVVSESYISQVQHQLYVSKAKKSFFYVAKLEQVYGVYRIAGTRLVEVYPDMAKQEQIVKACLEFYKLMKSDVPPPLTDRDPMELTDADSILVFSEFKREGLTDKDKKQLRDKAIKIAEKHHNYVVCGGVKLKKTNGVWRVNINE